MNENELQFQLTYSKIITISWIITIAVSVIYLILGVVIVDHDEWYSFTLSYFLGAMTSFFAFNLLKNNVANITGAKKGEIVGSFSNYLVRYLIYAGVLFISFKNYTKDMPEKVGILNPYIVATGFITIRLAIYIYTYLDKKKKGGNE